MPRRRNLQGDVDKIVSAMKICKNPMEFRRLQCVYLGIMYPDMTARKIGETTLYSERQVKEIHMNYRKEGLERLADMRGGRYRQYMTLDEETEFLKPFEEESKSGKIAVANEIKIAYEAKLGKEVAESTIYRLLDRHGFRKIVPYKRHLKADVEEQEAFKKTLSL